MLLAELYHPSVVTVVETVYITLPRLVCCAGNAQLVVMCICCTSGLGSSTSYPRVDFKRKRAKTTTQNKKDLWAIIPNCGHEN